MNLPDIEQALKLFDETTSALSARIHRLEAVLLQKTRELAAKVDELDHIHAYLGQVMGAVASGVLAVDCNGRITTANPAAEKALSGVIDTLVGADYRAAFPDSPLLRILDGSAEVVGDYERQIRPSEGGRRALAAKAAPLRAADGSLLGAVEVFEDVTEIRRLRELVDRSDRLQQLGEMAAGVAHEIRNPLNGIEGFASLLARDIPSDDPKARFARLIIEGVRHLNHTVTGLLEYAKPRRLERAHHDPSGLVASVIELLRVDGDLDQVTVELVDNHHGEPILCDGNQLRQVLINLVRNAIQAVRELPQPRVVVTISNGDDDDPAVTITVDDNGPGIPSDDRQRIFTPFFTTKDEGTGLGLAVSHTIVDLHGGQLLVEDSPFGGARLRVVLPA
jgi:signal transduction histidine kinase